MADAAHLSWYCAVLAIPVSIAIGLDRAERFAGVRLNDDVLHVGDVQALRLHVGERKRCDECVVARAEIDGLALVHLADIEDRHGVVTRAGAHRVGARTGCNVVVAVCRLDGVVARPRDDDAVPALGPDVVAPSHAYDALIRSAGLEDVVVWREDDIGEPRWTARPAAAWAEGGNHASRWRTRACSGLATLGQGAHVADVAWRSIGLDRTRAHAGRRVARARRVTLVDRRADHGVAAGARSILAGIRLRTRVRVRARRAVGDWRVLHAGNRIATIGGARIVVVDRDGAPRLARARLAIIPRGARVAVAARCTVRFG